MSSLFCSYRHFFLSVCACLSASVCACLEFCPDGRHKKVVTSPVSCQFLFVFENFLVLHHGDDVVVVVSNVTIFLCS
eukprot:m.135408 g.135408  ORF g.135408 m.135408 type:complete len:77 (+) comp15847_c0_seq1:1443-1673(+)